MLFQKYKMFVAPDLDYLNTENQRISTVNNKPAWLMNMAL